MAIQSSTRETVGLVHLLTWMTMSSCWCAIAVETWNNNQFHHGLMKGISYYSTGAYQSSHLCQWQWLWKIEFWHHHLVLPLWSVRWGITCRSLLVWSIVSSGFIKKTKKNCFQCYESSFYKRGEKEGARNFFVHLIFY